MVGNNPCTQFVKKVKASGTTADLETQMKNSIDLTCQSGHLVILFGGVLDYSENMINALIGIWALQTGCAVLTPKFEHYTIPFNQNERSAMVKNYIEAKVKSDHGKVGVSILLSLAAKAPKPEDISLTQSYCRTETWPGKLPCLQSNLWVPQSPSRLKRGQFRITRRLHPLFRSRMIVVLRDPLRLPGNEEHRGIPKKTKRVKTTKAKGKKVSLAENYKPN